MPALSADNLFSEIAALLLISVVAGMAKTALRQPLIVIIIEPGYPTVIIRDIARKHQIDMLAVPTCGHESLPAAVSTL